MHIKKVTTLKLSQVKTKVKKVKVIATLPQKDRVVVEGVNIMKNTKTNSIKS